MSCCLTGTDISYGEEAYLFPLVKSGQKESPWLFAGFPIKAYYHNYGYFTLENGSGKYIQTHNPHRGTEPYLLHGFTLVQKGESFFTNEEIIEMTRMNVMPGYDEFIEFFAVKKNALDKLCDIKNNIVVAGELYYFISSVLVKLAELRESDDFLEKKHTFFSIFSFVNIFNGNSRYLYNTLNDHLFKMIVAVDDKNQILKIHEENVVNFIEKSKLSIVISLYTQNANIPVVPTSYMDRMSRASYFRYFLNNLKMVDSKYITDKNQKIKHGFSNGMF